jgi:hypothetical protein
MILGMGLLAEHPYHPVQLLFVAILGEDREPQSASGRFVYRVSTRLIHGVQPPYSRRPRRAPAEQGLAGVCGRCG